MFDKWFKAPIHYYLLISALCILAVGVSTSNVLMSIGTIWLIANWIIEGQFRLKITRFQKEPIIWVFAFLFLFGIFSLLWSSDVAYGIHDLRIKLPLIIIPLVLSTSNPPQKTHFYLIILVFLGSLFFTSVWNYIQYNVHISEINDVRQMSRFISHVRLSILINFGIFFTYYLILKKKYVVFILIPLLMWFIFYQYQSQVVNGYGLFVILAILSTIYWINNIKRKSVKRFASVILGFFILSVTLGSFYLWHTVHIKVPIVDYKKLDLYTVNGNGYYHQKNTNITEDGKLVYLYISEKESRRAWAKRSEIDFDSIDRKGHPIAGTIYRYMTSKSLRKDSLGFLKLQDEDVQNIENGFSNYKTNRGLSEKIRDLKMQWFMLRSKGNPNGNSLIQRKLHLLAAGGIIRDHWLLGVGIGDVQSAFSNEYKKQDSLLLLENQHRSHNQFLTLWISHGLVGFISILLLWFLPFVKYLKTCDYLLCVVLIGFGFSFLWQDMLETQAGVTIFALFYSLMVFKSRKYVSN